MQTVDSFLVCPHNLGEKRQINLSYQNFKPELTGREA